MSQPIITYYGGKQRLVKYILPNIPPHSVYCEPMVGGGAVFFSKAPSASEIINDTDAMIAIFYRVMQNHFDILKAKIEQTLYCRSTHKVAHSIRQMPHLFTELQIAWAFFTLTGMGFSGTLDSFGCYTKGTKARTYERKKERFTPELKQRLQGVQIENTDGHKLIKQRDSQETFFYVDPPYPNTHQSHYRGYSMENFIELLEILSHIRGTFLLSAFPSLELDRYIKDNGWHCIAINQTKPASSNADGSKKRKTELLIANYPIS